MEYIYPSMLAFICYLLERKITIYIKLVEKVTNTIQIMKYSQILFLILSSDFHSTDIIIAAQHLLQFAYNEISNTKYNR